MLEELAELLKRRSFDLLANTATARIDETRRIQFGDERAGVVPSEEIPAHVTRGSTYVERDAGRLADLHVIRVERRR